MISRWGYNPEAHEALNCAVNGLIDESHPITDVRDVVSRTEEFAGTTKGVAPGAVETAKGTIKDVLKHRLREAASDAIFVGRKRLEHSQVGRLENSLSDAQACGWLDNEVDFAEFASLLRNFQVRGDAGSVCRDHATAERLVQQLQDIIKPPARQQQQPRLTEVTLTAVLTSLLRMIQGNPEACEQIVRLGAISTIERLFLGDLDYGVQAPDPGHPEVQMCLAHLLAEVALQHAEADRRHTLEARSVRSWEAAVSRPASTNAAVNKFGSALMVSAKSSRPVSMDSVLKDESKSAIDTLRQGLQGSLARSEHSAVWAVITALQRLAHHENGCQMLLLAGFLPILLRVRKLYSEFAADGTLPLAIPRPKPQPPAISKDVQFVGPTAIPSALVRKPVTTKERWLSGGLLESLQSPLSSSMPDLRQQSHRNSVDFLGGSPKNSPKKKSKRLGRSLSRAATNIAGSPTGASALMDFSAKDSAPQYPPLSWLIGEDGVDKESFYRVCDRSFMLLQLQKLLSTMEKVGGKMAAPFQERTQPKHGIMGGRPPSRGRPTSQASRGGSRGTNSRGTNRSAKRAASPS